MKLITKVYFNMVNAFNAHSTPRLISAILGLQKLATEK
jgi:hypothetical protein